MPCLTQPSGFIHKHFLFSSVTIKTYFRQTKTIWLSVTEQGSLGMECFLPQAEMGPKHPSQVPQINVASWKHVPMEAASAFGQRVYQVAAAQARWKAIVTAKGEQKSKTAETYFADRHLHKTAKLSGRLSSRNLGFERGYHWLKRLRCGAFWLTGPAIRANLIKPVETGGKCAVCRVLGRKDSVAHFLFNCPNAELVKIRKRIPIEQISKTLRRVAAKRQTGHLSFNLWSDDGLPSLLLGGQYGGVSMALDKAVLNSLSTTDGNSLDAAYGSSKWRKGASPLAEVAMHVLATFLDSAMPIRNFFLWARPTEEIKEKRASDSLGQRHDKG